MSKKEFDFYRLCKYSKTNEWHIFGVTLTRNQESPKLVFTTKAKSLCEEVELKNSSQRLRIRIPRHLRFKAAKIGKQVCGTCISHLYLTKRS